uniref:Uncharacterized protein n=1 Tax=Scleropages formosus TaxID=113540 RepID=A0A8C9SGT2_SCLFO
MLPDMSLVDVLYGEPTAQHLDKHLHRAEVEEGVSDWMEDHVALQVRHVPVSLGLGCCHDAADLVRHPACKEGWRRGERGIAEKKGKGNMNNFNF